MKTAISDQRLAVSDQSPIGEVVIVKTEPDDENREAIQTMLMHALEWRKQQEETADEPAII